MKATLPALLAAVLLAGCASQPSYIALSPELPAVKSVAVGQLLTLSTVDNRKANFIVRINEDGKAARLVAPGESPQAQIEDLLRQGLTKAGYQFGAGSDTSVEFQLEQLLTDVNEGTFGFEANSNLVISVMAFRRPGGGNEQQYFSKRYTARGTLKGPFSADFATLELELNKLITKLSADILNDSELHQFLTR
ncbi:YajG family lipoprotein [Shewanella cyperi]|uniref:YajG family lipoprotein n=1 Tax=Shewanella cyperi TaxID=2814292 RepID=A0A974XRH8_9GAMM|nr:YajG family lipoprotein [Shewanella cyperi]QSX29154.1 YajG family lipoprotein [Shewanella cyperi]QSX39899.1 YajG family lipoprotein [Shewanella cyperi]